MLLKRFEWLGTCKSGTRAAVYPCIHTAGRPKKQIVIKIENEARDQWVAH